jgi:hypothetical protein
MTKSSAGVVVLSGEDGLPPEVTCQPRPGPLRRPAPQHPPGRPRQHRRPKVVAATFGMTAESVMIYLAGRIDPGRLTEPPGRSL